MTSGDAGFEARLVAVPASASIVRDRLRAWLGALGWPDPELDDVVLAVHEAVTNSIEHGYAGVEPGDVVVSGRVDRGRDGRFVHLVVRDTGRWRTPRDPGFRGRGLPVMRGCMDGVTVRGDRTGTVVEMRSHPVTPADLGARWSAPGDDPLVQ
jgi:serine/threonine-protein kinase RsbW